MVLAAWLRSQISLSRGSLCRGGPRAPTPSAARVPTAASPKDGAARGQRARVIPGGAEDAHAEQSARAGVPVPKPEFHLQRRRSENPQKGACSGGQRRGRGQTRDFLGCGQHLTLSAHWVLCTILHRTHRTCTSRPPPR